MTNQTDDDHANNPRRTCVFRPLEESALCTSIRTHDSAQQATGLAVSGEDRFRSHRMDKDAFVNAQDAISEFLYQAATEISLKYYFLAAEMGL